MKADLPSFLIRLSAYGAVTERAKSLQQLTHTYRQSNRSDIERKKEVPQEEEEDLTTVVAFGKSTHRRVDYRLACTHTLDGGHRRR